MKDEEKEYIKEVNIDKAKNKAKVALGIIILSLLTYVIGFWYGEFDFGLIFEVISLVFLIVAIIYISKYDEIRAKRYIICSMLAIGWILVYDIIIFFISIKNIEDLVILMYYYFWGEILSILYLSIMFAINNDLSKADNPIKYKESTDWFYETYEDDKNKEIKK
jgi:hypothetical protein